MRWLKDFTNTYITFDRPTLQKQHDLARRFDASSVFSTYSAKDLVLVWIFLERHSGDEGLLLFVINALKIMVTQTSRNFSCVELNAIGLALAHKSYQHLSQPVLEATKGIYQQGNHTPTAMTFQMLRQNAEFPVRTSVTFHKKQHLSDFLFKPENHSVILLKIAITTIDGHIAAASSNNVRVEVPKHIYGCRWLRAFCSPTTIVGGVPSDLLQAIPKRMSSQIIAALRSSTLLLSVLQRADVIELSKQLAARTDHHIYLPLPPKVT